MAHVTQPEVQSWLEATKLTISTVDAELEATAAVTVFGALTHDYDTTTWTDSTTTPAIVRKVIAMFVAAWTYNRQYSEDAPDGNAYANWLEAKANMLLQGLIAGTIDIIEVPGVPVSIGTPTFYPDDTTGAVAVYDALGNQVFPTGADDIKFRMGTVF